MIPIDLTASNLIYQKISSTVTDLGVECVVGIPQTDVTGTGGCQVSILQQDTGWESDRFHRALHPVGIVNIYADSDRDSQGSLVEANAANKALGIFNRLDPLLDYATPWPGVISCRRQQEPNVYDVDGDPSTHAVMLHARYELVLS